MSLGNPPDASTRAVRPSASTTSTACTWSTVAPYTIEWVPPEFVAVIPPTVH